MARNGTVTREKILLAAQQLVLDFGFGGMSVDQVITEAGITKGAFFHHFKSKHELGQTILDRYVENDDKLLHELVGRSESLSHDPLQQYLIFVGLLEEALSGSEEPMAGCLVASYIYQLEIFGPETRHKVIKGFQEWERILVAKLDVVLEKYTPKRPITAEEIYRNLMALFEGGVILAKLYNQGPILGEQVAQHKKYLELLFGQYEK